MPDGGTTAGPRARRGRGAARPRGAAWRGPALVGILALAACGDDAATTLREDSEVPTTAATEPTTAATEPTTPTDSALAGALAGDDCLVILLDALHADHLGAWGNPRADVSPRIDALAADGVRVLHAWSPTSWTLPSTTSLFTGLYQETHGLEFSVVDDSAVLSTKRLAERALTMAELFRAAGYETACWTQNAWTSARYGLDQGFDTYEEVRWGREQDSGWTMAGEVAERLAAPSARPRFVYAHFRRPHTPFDPPEDVLREFVDPSYSGPVTGTDEDVEAHNTKRRPMSEADHGRHVDRYEANIHQVDLCVGRILDAIDLEQTLVVILSDHGEAFGQHGSYGHNWHSYEEFVHVPLVLHHPRLTQGLQVRGLVSTIDVLPTLAELFGLPLDRASVQGESFAPALSSGEPTSRGLVFTSARLDARGQRDMAVCDGRFKFVRQHPSGREWLYDLQADPTEQHDVLDEQPEVSARLRAELGGWFTGQRATFVDEKVPEGIDPEQLEELRRLGYLGGADASAAGGADDREDH